MDCGGAASAAREALSAGSGSGRSLAICVSSRERARHQEVGTGADLKRRSLTRPLTVWLAPVILAPESS